MHLMSAVNLVNFRSSSAAPSTRKQIIERTLLKYLGIAAITCLINSCIWWSDIVVTRVGFYTDCCRVVLGQHFLPQYHTKMIFTVSSVAPFLALIVKNIFLAFHNRHHRNSGESGATTAKKVITVQSFRFLIFSAPGLVTFTLKMIYPWNYNEYNMAEQKSRIFLEYYVSDVAEYCLVLNHALNLYFVLLVLPQIRQQFLIFLCREIVHVSQE